jgi:hypothetical protein
MTGVAVSFVTADAEAHFRLIEKRHQLRLPREVIAGFEPTEPSPEVDEVSSAIQPAAATGGIKGKRKSKKDKLREAAARGQATETTTPTLRGADIWQRRRPPSATQSSCNLVVSALAPSKMRLRPHPSDLIARHHCVHDDREWPLQRIGSTG